MLESASNEGRLAKEQRGARSELQQGRERVSKRLWYVVEGEDETGVGQRYQW
jgi:hypothetical protein